MAGSVFSKAADDTRDKATKLGHTLGTWDVRKCSARATCSTCLASVLIVFHLPVWVQGIAVESPCRAGEKNDAPAPSGAPTTGQAKKRPKAPTTPADVWNEALRAMQTVPVKG